MIKSISNRTFCLLISGILLASVFSSCKTTQQAVDYKDLSYLYNPTKVRLIQDIMLLIRQMNLRYYLSGFPPAIFFSLKLIPRAFRLLRYYLQLNFIV